MIIYVYVFDYMYIVFVNFLILYVNCLFKKLDLYVRLSNIINCCSMYDKVKGMMWLLI